MKTRNRDKTQTTRPKNQRAPVLALTVLVVLFGVMLAGCLDAIAPQVDPVDEDKTADQDENAGEDTIDDQVDEAPHVDLDVQFNETWEPPENDPPVARLASDYTTVQVPFTVTFDLDGEDPDGDELMWFIDFDDGSDGEMGFELPVTLNHTFEDVGEYVVFLMVSDGIDIESDIVMIAVLEGPNDEKANTGAACLFSLTEGATGPSVPAIYEPLTQNDEQALVDEVEPGSLAALRKVEPDDTTLEDTLGLEATILVDYFDESHEWVGVGFGGGEKFVVPDDAAYGVVCVAHRENVDLLGTTTIYVPLTDWTWGYQDGFIEPS